MSEGPFRMMPYGKYDKEKEIQGPDDFRFYVDYDDVNQREVDQAIDKLLDILNKFWYLVE